MAPLAISAHDADYRIEDPGGVIGKALATGAPYEAKVCEQIYRRELRGLAVDVGANVGNHTLWFSLVCGLDVVAVEPISVEALRHNLELNSSLLRAGQVRVWPIALGAHPGTATAVGKGRLAPGGKIKVGRLDDFGLTGVALVKIDVEGMEPQVLRGGLETIRRERPVLYAEAWDDEAHRRVAEIVEPEGYEHTRTFGATPLEEWEPR